MVLTDGRGTRLKRLLWLWGLGGAAVIGLCAGGGLWVMYLQAQAATHHRLDVTLVGLAITMVVLGTFLAISLPGITFNKSLHRYFRVRVDFLQRTCICESRFFGIPLRKRRVDSYQANWNSGERLYRLTLRGNDRMNIADIILSIFLLLLGPLGLIFGLFWGSRNRVERIVSHRVTLLELFDGEQAVAVVSVPDAETAERFLTQWNRNFDRSSRTGK